MLILGLDFETTGFEHEKDDRITEVGAVLWDTEQRNPVRILSELVMYDPEGIPPLSEEVMRVTGLNHEIINEHGLGMTQILNYKGFQSMLTSAEYLVAHNAPFDRAFLEKELNLVNESWKPQMKHFKWIDTRTDLPREAYLKGKSTALGYLAADHGFINPFPHRAVTDVLTMLKLMSLYDFDEIVKRSEAPTVTVVAQVSFEQKDKAKNAGFHWNKPHWQMNVKECDLQELAEKWDFPVKELVQ